MMNAIDILRFGHQTVVTAVAELPQNEWQTPGVCGHWSVKEIVAHLASFEQLLVELLTNMVEDDAPTPTLDHMLADEAQFNDVEVARRQAQSVDAVWNAYEAAYETAVSLLAQLPQEKLRQNGLLPWYGAEYDLEDFLVYTFYGHKREHCAQIDLFRDKLAIRKNP